MAKSVTRNIEKLGLKKTSSGVYKKAIGSLRITLWPGETSDGLDHFELRRYGPGKDVDILVHVSKVDPKNSAKVVNILELIAKKLKKASDTVTEAEKVLAKAERSLDSATEKQVSALKGG